MPYAKFDDNFPEHAKIWPLSDGAYRLLSSAIIWSARTLTDGRVPADRLPLLMPRYKPAYLRELEDRDVMTKDGDDYLIHDFTQWNDSRSTIMRRRERNAERQRKWREQRDHKPDDDE